MITSKYMVQNLVTGGGHSDLANCASASNIAISALPSVGMAFLLPVLLVACGKDEPATPDFEGYTNVVQPSQLHPAISTFWGDDQSGIIID